MPMIPMHLVYLLILDLLHHVNPLYLEFLYNKALVYHVHLH